MVDDASHYAGFAAAYVRGMLGAPDLDDAAAIARAAPAGLDLHRFKRNPQLARIRPVLGALRGFGARRLVDLGSGRGAFVWPLLDELPDLCVTATDVLAHRARLFAAVGAGGIARLTGVRADLTALPYADASVDCVTALEVFEHLPGDAPARAVREALRVARTAVIASVPSREDDNPDHVQLFDAAQLTALFEAAGARRVRTEHVLNHLIAIAVH